MDRYSKYQEDGDQYVGRCCSGLPQMDERFATARTFFKTNDPEYLYSCIDVLFPNRPPLPIKLAEQSNLLFYILKLLLLGENKASFIAGRKRAHIQPIPCRNPIALTDF